jgi:hypothetical protein
MMRNDDCRAIESLLELAHEPCPARLVKRDRILRPKLVPALFDADEVVHGSPGAFAGKPGFTFPVQLEVSPKRAAKEADAVQNEHFVTQHRDVFRRCRFELRSQVDVVAVELVIARYIDDRPNGIMTRRPAHTLHAHTNVAGKNHRFGIRFGWHEVRELGVQIAQDVEFHGSARRVVAEA